jgi:hypothetical protein
MRGGRSAGYSAHAAALHDAAQDDDHVIGIEFGQTG